MREARPTRFWIAVLTSLAAVGASFVFTASAVAVCVPIEGGTMRFRPAIGRRSGHLVWKARDKSISFLIADPTLGTTSVLVSDAGVAVLALAYGSASAPAWQSAGAPTNKWQYRAADDPSAIAGISRMTSQPTRFILKGRGGVLDSLSTPALLPLTFQVTDSSGACAEVTFTSCGQNNAKGIKCRRDVRFDTFTADIPNSVDTIVDDMMLPHQARVHGVPLSFDWALAPVVHSGNTPPSSFTAMTAWGQAYEAANGNRAKNTRIQIRNMKAYILSKQDNQWHLLQDVPAVVGAAYREDFLGDINKPADIRAEADGGISVTVGGGYNFHFYSPTRASIVPSDIGGVFTTVEARLILDNPSGRDDRAKARYLLDMGGDYWLDLFADFQNFATNSGIGLGRFRYVTTGWQSFNMITLSDADVRRNPPPLQ